MAKGYSFTDISKPTSPSASAVSGGSLNANTTYYYRVMKVSASATTVYFNGKSQVSDQFSVTTDSVNKKARITFTCPYVSGQSYRIWRSTSPTAIGSTYLGCISFYPTDNLYNSSGTVTFDDDGTYAISGSNFCETSDQAHGTLTLSGSTSSDKFSIVDLYNADVANGWGVIQKLDVNTYKVNCFLVGHTSMYWEDKLKTIILADGANIAQAGVNFTFGAISGSNYTSQGCEIIVTSNWLTSISFPNLYAYRTIFKYIFPQIPDPGQLGLTGGGFSAGIVQDCQVDRWRNFAPSAGCTVKNFVMSRFDNAFSNGSATFNSVRMLSGSRIWQISGGNQNIVGRGIYSESTYAVLVIGANSTSSLSTIDSIISQSISINSSSTGFKWYDKFSYNLKILDSSGNGVSGVNVKVYDKDNAVVADVNSDSNGDIAEQFITRRYFEVSGTSLLPENNRNPFTIVVSKNGYETYTEKLTYSSSLAVVKTLCLKTAKAIRLDIKGNQYFAVGKHLGSSAKLLKL